MRRLLLSLALWTLLCDDTYARPRLPWSRASKASPLDDNKNSSVVEDPPSAPPPRKRWGYERKDDTTEKQRTRGRSDDTLGSTDDESGNQTTVTDSNRSNETITTPADVNNTTQSESPSTCETVDSNTTVTQNTTRPEPASPPSASVVVMGGPSYRVLRSRPMIAQQSPPQNSVMMAELLGSVLGTVSRVWLLTWITRRLASQEEVLQPTQHFVWERLNDRYVRDVAALQTAVRQPPPGLSLGGWRRRRSQGRYRAPKTDWKQTFQRTVVVLTVESDNKGNMDVDFMASAITFLLDQHRAHAFGTRKGDNEVPMDMEVVLNIQSPGGSVATYGLAAAQIQRLRNQTGVTVTACVDKFAASGGYMMASQAHRIVAAPFASVGSIGVILTGLNFHELVRRYGIQPLVLKAGSWKNPLSQFGEISKRDLAHEEERLGQVHTAFKELVANGRPEVVDIEEVANGNVFLGTEALDLKLIDAIMTSDEYIVERIRAGDRVLKLHRSHQARFPRRTNLSILDILPHLRSWAASLLQNPDRLAHWGSAALMLEYVVRHNFLN